jgi:hypothetical protein
MVFSPLANAIPSWESLLACLTDSRTTAFLSFGTVYATIRKDRLTVHAWEQNKTICGRPAVSGG